MSTESIARESTDFIDTEGCAGCDTRQKERGTTQRDVRTREKRDVTRLRGVCGHETKRTVLLETLSKTHKDMQIVCACVNHVFDKEADLELRGQRRHIRICRPPSALNLRDDGVICSPIDSDESIS